MEKGLKHIMTTLDSKEKQAVRQMSVMVSQQINYPGVISDSEVAILDKMYAKLGGTLFNIKVIRTSIINGFLTLN